MEVFPYAVKRRLWGKPIPKKSTPAGLAYLNGGLRNLISDLPVDPLLTHDLADAVLAAYTALLHHQGLTETLGDATEGQIVIPLAPARYRSDLILSPLVGES